MVVPRGHLRIVVRNDADFLQGCRGTSARVDAVSAQADPDFLCGRVRIFRANSG